MVGVGNVSLTRREFHARSAHANVVPLFRRLLGDMHTPISLFLRLRGDTAENSFLLESVIQGERLGRHSFLGVGARGIIRGHAGRFERLSADGTRAVFEGEPLALLEREFAGLRPAHDERLPDFSGGAVGFLAYDAIRYYEKLPDKNPNDTEQEDAYFILCDELVIFDHIRRDIRLVHNVRLDEYASVDAAYDAGVAAVEALERRIHAPLVEPEPKTVSGRMPVASNMSAEDFQRAVVRAKENIVAGDIFQVVLSKRYDFQPEVPSFQVYRALRSINPSPYMYYLNAGPYRIVGSSPEILVNCHNRRVALRPIAGTRRRGRTPAEDLALEKDLLSDAKEIAEHIMLVDLGRNDAGRVCVPGSVRVTEFEVIERYSHVMHIVSHCEGELSPDFSPLEALRAALPAGTLTGAPKIRAMEIIDELENVRRGIYGGCIGYFSYNRDYDTAIAIRTMIFQGEVCHLQAGAGVVFDSDPVKECEEVANKVRAMFKAVRFARRGLRQ